MKTTDKPVVLVVDDDQKHREMMKMAFEGIGHKVNTAATFDGGVRTIRSIVDNEDDAIGVALVDIHLKGRSTGLNLLRYIKSEAADRMVGYALTGDDSVIVENEALDAGAKFLFRKGVDSIDRIMLYAQREIVIPQLRQKEELNGDLDDLTGLYNYKTFRKLVKAQLKAARSSRGHTKILCMLLIDVDDFKSVNDRHGYLVGDELLRMIGLTLNNHIRPSDTGCHKSGDEFLVLVPDLDENIAAEVGKKLQRDVGIVSVVDNAGKRVCRPISFGVGQIRREEIMDDLDSSFKELFNRANLGPRGLEATRAYKRR